MWLQRDFSVYLVNMLGPKPPSYSAQVDKDVVSGLTQGSPLEHCGCKAIL